METLLEGAIKKIIEFAHNRNINFPIARYQTIWMKKTGKNTSQSQQGIYEFPDFLRLYRDLKEEIENIQEVRDFRKCVEKFSKENGNFLPFFSVNDSIGRQTEFILDSYFYEVNEFKLDKKIVCLTCRKFKEDICSKQATLVAILKVDGFESVSSFALEEGIIFRKTTMKDIQNCSIYRRFEMLSPYAESLNIDGWVCEIRKDIQKDRAGAQPDIAKEITINNFHLLPELIAESFNLVHSSRLGLQLMYKTMESRYIRNSVTAGGKDIFTSRHSDKAKITKRKITQLQEIYKTMKSFKNSNEYEDLGLPLRRLRLAASRQDLSDHVVDCVIGMEYLLAPGGGESKYKFCMRGASLLSNKFGTVEERKKLMNDLYDKRSAIVHGRRNAQEKIKNISPMAEAALRELFVWYLTKGKEIGNRNEIAGKLDLSFINGGRTVRNAKIS